MGKRLEGRRKGAILGLYQYHNGFDTTNKFHRKTSFDKAREETAAKEAAKAYT